MQEYSLDFYVTAAYFIAATLTLIFLGASLWRARRAARTLASFEREDA